MKYHVTIEETRTYQYTVDAEMRDLAGGLAQDEHERARCGGRLYAETSKTDVIHVVKTAKEQN